MSRESEAELDISGVGPGEFRVVDHEGISILVCNVAGDFYAVENVCSHAQVPLSDGDLNGCEIECIFHGAVFDVRNGEPLAPPATQPVRTFELERSGDRLTIHIGF
ncbi:MAG: non-heme iron oxygenase ferredoxin subunit [Myxococcota bacterium]